MTEIAFEFMQFVGHEDFQPESLGVCNVFGSSTTHTYKQTRDIIPWDDELLYCVRERSLEEVT